MNEGKPIIERYIAIAMTLGGIVQCACSLTIIWRRAVPKESLINVFCYVRRKCG